jgi:hypothetical protein
MFKGRNLVIATKHQKEIVIAGPFEKALGVTCFTSEALFDTDHLGNFTGEITRSADPVSTAREKCLRGMEVFDCEMGIASEGSFFPDPHFMLGYVNEEVLIFIDKWNELEIIVKEISFDTNFHATSIYSEEELIEVAEKLEFPSHGLILKASENDSITIIKGITTWSKLKDSFSELFKIHGSVWLETDMRALYNPSRMAVIEKGVHKLIEKINNCCEECGTPGFGITDINAGLPCSWCGCPTNSILSYTHSCSNCTFTSLEMYPKGKKKEDPMYCNSCNP